MTKQVIGITGIKNSGKTSVCEKLIRNHEDIELISIGKIYDKLLIDEKITDDELARDLYFIYNHGYSKFGDLLQEIAYKQIHDSDRQVFIMDSYPLRPQQLQDMKYVFNVYIAVMKTAVPLAMDRQSKLIKGKKGRRFADAGESFEKLLIRQNDLILKLQDQFSKYGDMGFNVCYVLNNKNEPGLIQAAADFIYRGAEIARMNYARS